MKRTALVRRTPLSRVSSRRAEELRRYRGRCAQFLELHPYCQVWLAEHGIDEAAAVRRCGWVRLCSGARVRAPRASSVHHTNKRRHGRLLDETRWMAVSAAGHAAIEVNKPWARARGYLSNF